jgi:hypothetical protein
MQTVLYPLPVLLDDLCNTAIHVLLLQWSTACVIAAASDIAAC